MRTAALLAWLVALALGGSALAVCPGDCPVPGGGSRRTDCLSEFAGVTPGRAGGGRVRCTDGDPTCDTDGSVNGACRFRVSVCLNNADPRLPRCSAEGVRAFRVVNAGTPRVDQPGALEAAVDALGLPTPAARCSTAVSVFTALRGTRRFRPGVTRLRTTATSTSGRRDVDQLRLVCVPAPTLRRRDGAYATARVVTQPAELIDGPLARGRLGDVLLANDRIQVVIQQPGRAMFGIGSYGGTIIDADRQRPGEEERDNFEELLPQINVENTANYTSVQVLHDGADGQPAVVRATGPDDLLDFVNPSSVVEMAGFAFPPAADDRDLPVNVQTDYTLAPGTSWVRLDTTVFNLDAAPLDIFLGDYLNGSGEVELFQPSYGFGEPLVTLSCPAEMRPACTTGTCDVCATPAYAGVGGAADVSYGYVHATDRSSTFTVSGVSAVLLGNEVLYVLVGLATPNFHLAAAGTAGDAITITRWFVVGDGSVGSITDARHVLRGVTTGTLAGRVTSGGVPVPGADIAVLGPALAAGPAPNVVTGLRTDGDGRYHGTLPPGAYGVRANQDGRRFGAPDPAAVTIVADATTTQDFELPAAGALRVAVTDADGTPIPAKVQLVGFDPSPDPLAVQDIAGGVVHNVTGVFRDRSQDPLPFGIAAVAFADRTGDTGVLPVEPGEYQLAVTRGPRWSMFQQRITVTAGQTTAVAARLVRVVDTPGFIAADFHLHAIDSPDSEVTRVQRVASQLGDGLDFITPSDHDMRVDFQPTIDAMGVGDLIATAASAEITTFDYGHFNSWPVTIDPAQLNGGSVDWGRAGIAPGADFPALGSYGLAPVEIFAAAHADPRANLIQINHIDSFFNVTGLDIDTAEGGTGPPQSHVSPASRRLDPGVSNYFDASFDALEVWNGSQAIFLGQNIGDWFNLLNQGITRTAVADSDTHERRTDGGAVRTYVASAVSAPVALAADPETLAATIVAGHASGTNGPFVTITAHAVSTGETAGLALDQPTHVATTDGAVDVTVTVASPLWAQFDRVELYVSSAPQPWDHDDNPATRPRYRVIPDVVRSAPADFTVATVTDRADVPDGEHLAATVTIALTGLAEDAWIVALVRGTAGVSRPLFPALPYSLQATGNDTLDALTDGNLGEGGDTALAFTNPLYVLADGDQTWTPPGVHLTPP